MAGGCCAASGNLRFRRFGFFVLRGLGFAQGRAAFGTYVGF